MTDSDPNPGPGTSEVQSRQLFNPAPSCDDANEYGSLRAEAALNLILARVAAVSGSEWIMLRAGLNRVLTEEVRSPADVPAHTNSAVDGYALRCADLGGEEGLRLRVVDRVFAGQKASRKVEPGACIRIMTGAMLPEGADTVVMQEQVELGPDDTIRVFANLKAGDNVRGAGEDLKHGQIVLKAGRLLSPADIGMLASLGLTEIRVRRRVRVGILSTGNEVKPVGASLIEGGVYDSNRHTLRAMLSHPGIEVRDYGVIPDEPARLHESLRLAHNDNDLVITSGGVSVGEADHTRNILDALGEVVFSKVAIKPGRPLTFAMIGARPLFGLPGNPVAVMVTFYQFVWPALKKLMGIDPPGRAFTLKARALNRIRKKSGRTEYQRGILEQDEHGLWTVRITGKQGSGILHSMSLANAFIVLPHDSDSIEAGDEITVQPFEAFR